MKVWRHPGLRRSVGTECGRNIGWHRDGMTEITGQTARWRSGFLLEQGSTRIQRQVWFVEVLRRWRSRKIPSGRVLHGWQRSLRGHLRSTDRSVVERERERESSSGHKSLWCGQQESTAIEGFLKKMFWRVAGLSTTSPVSFRYGQQLSHSLPPGLHVYLMIQAAACRVSCLFTFWFYFHRKNRIMCLQYGMA